MSARGSEQKVALVTGGANGIGLATAAAFGRAGLRVAIADHEAVTAESAAAALRAEGIDCIALCCDVTEEAACLAMVAEVECRFGRLDCAVNAAGISGGGPDRARTADYATEVWHRVLAVNLTGVFFCAKAQIPAILRAGGGAIVNIASIMGLRGAAEIPAYVAAKHGVIGLTRTMADEYAAAGLRCTALAPGMVDTRMNGRFTADPALMKAALSAIPQGRFARPDEIAAAAVWLCSEQASFVTGTCLTVDGGQLLRA